MGPKIRKIGDLYAFWDAGIERWKLGHKMDATRKMRETIERWG